jgi:L-rhamnose mutarotase
MKKYCFALDLIDDQTLIAEYDQYHINIWPEIYQSIKTSGINEMEIYRHANRLFMIMEVNDDFSFEKKRENDAANPKVIEWESLMWKYQKALPMSNPNEKWILLNKIFDLKTQ